MEGKAKKENDLLEGQNVDFSMTTFECDRCIFRKFRKPDHREDIQKDTFLMELIRSANFDAY